MAKNRWGLCSTLALTTAACFGALHFLPDPLDLGSVHAVVGQRPLFQEFLAVLAVG